MDKIDKAFIDFYKPIGKAYGMDDLTASIFARLFIEPGEISMSELAAETGYSLSSISNKVKLLEPTGFVTRQTKPGTRKVYLYTRKNILDILMWQLNRVRLNEIERAKTKIPPLVTHHDEKSLTDVQKEKIAILKQYHDDLMKFDDVLNEILEKLENDQ